MTGLPTTGRVVPAAWVPGIVPIRVEAIRIHGPTLGELYSKCPWLWSETQRSRDLAYRIAARSTACMAQHEVHERLARWLLEVADEVESTEFAIALAGC
jgi:hypothetical protein